MPSGLDLELITPKQAFREALKLSPVLLTCMTNLKGIIFLLSPSSRGLLRCFSFPILFFLIFFIVLVCFFPLSNFDKIALAISSESFFKVIYFNETKTQLTMVMVKSYRMTRSWR